MTWDDILNRLKRAGLNPIEDTYMENYGKILAAQRQQFRDRNFRCTYGAARVGGVRIEALMFPSELQLNDFLEVIGPDPWRVVHENAIIEFPECDPALISRVTSALGK